MDSTITTEPAAPKRWRSPKVLSVDQIAKRLSCTAKEVEDLISWGHLSTVRPFDGNEVTEAEVRRYLRDQERRRLEQERREKLESEGKDPAAMYIAELLKKQKPPNKLLTIPEIAERLHRSRRDVWKLLRSHCLQTFQPLYCRFEPQVWESEVQRFMDRRDLRLKCRRNRSSRLPEMPVPA